MHRSRRTLSAALIAAAATVALSLGTAAPAAAADLPEGDALYAITSWSWEGELWQLLSVDTATNETTRVGSFTAADPPYNGWQYQGHYDPGTGLGYYIRSFYDVSVDELIHQLFSVDPGTGTHALIGRLVEDPDGSPSYPYGGPLAIGPEGAYFIDNEGTDDRRLFRVDLITGEVEFVGTTPIFSLAFAYDAVTDAYYAITANEIAYFHEISVADGSVDAGVNLGGGAGSRIVSMQFDSQGGTWVLGAHELADGAFLGGSGLPLMLDGEYVFPEHLGHGGSLLLVPAASDDGGDGDGGDGDGDGDGDGEQGGGDGGLADSGAETPVAPLAAALLLLAGGFAVLLRTRERARVRP